MGKISLNQAILIPVCLLAAANVKTDPDNLNPDNNEDLNQPEPEQMDYDEGINLNILLK